MKSTITFLAIVYTVIAQASETSPEVQSIIAALPACGRVCLQNEFAKTSDFGCAPTDYTCLCNHLDFRYGIRDCANESCSSAADANEVIVAGNVICAAILGPPIIESSQTTAAASSTLTGFVEASSNEPAARTSSTLSSVYISLGSTTENATTGTIILQPTLVGSTHSTSATGYAGTVILIPTTGLGFTSIIVSTLVPSSSTIQTTTSSNIPQSTRPPKVQKKTPTGLIAGATIGGLIGLLFAIGIFYYIIRHCRRQEKDTQRTVAELAGIEY